MSSPIKIVYVLVKIMSISAHLALKLEGNSPLALKTIERGEVERGRERAGGRREDAQYEKKG